MTDVTLTAPATVTFVTTDSNNAQTTTTIHIAAPVTSGVQVKRIGDTTVITTTDNHSLAIMADQTIQYDGVKIPGSDGSDAVAYDPATGNVYGEDAFGSGWYQWNKSMSASTWTHSTFTA